MSALKSKSNPSGFPLWPGEIPSCLETRELPAVFLRLETARQRVAFPYAALMKLELSLDETEVELTFTTHSATVKGRNLRGLYEAASQAQAVQIRATPKDITFEAMLKALTSFVSEIRITPLDESELRRR